MNRVTEYLRPDEAVALLKRGGYLLAQYSAAGTAWFLMPSGSKIRPQDVRHIIHRPDVRPSGDGLLPGQNQTWRAR
jgi:hypothetical protein